MCVCVCVCVCVWLIAREGRGGICLSVYIKSFPSERRLLLIVSRGCVCFVFADLPECMQMVPCLAAVFPVNLYSVYLFRRGLFRWMHTGSTPAASQHLRDEFERHLRAGPNRTASPPGTINAGQMGANPCSHASKQL